MKFVVFCFITFAVCSADPISLLFDSDDRLNPVSEDHVAEEIVSTDRLRREANPEPFRESNRGQSNGGRHESGGGSWNVGVNKDKGRGPQVRAEGQKNIHTSRDGNWKVDAGGHWEAGKGRKPDYGVGVTATGRFRREANPEPFRESNRGQSNGGRHESGGGSWNVGVNKDKGRGPQVRAEGQKNIHTSRDGNWKVDTGGHFEAGKGRKPDYGVGVTATGRFRREADPQNKKVNTLIGRPEHVQGTVGGHKGPYHNQQQHHQPQHHQPQHHQPQHHQPQHHQPQHHQPQHHQPQHHQPQHHHPQHLRPQHTPPQHHQHGHLG